MDQNRNQFEFKDIGDRICDMVDKAVSSKDYSQLNQSIQNTIRQATDGLDRIVKTANDKVNEGVEWTKQQKWQDKADKYRQKWDKHANKKANQFSQGQGIPSGNYSHQNYAGTGAPQYDMRQNAKWQPPVLYGSTVKDKVTGGLSTFFGCGLTFSGGIGSAALIGGVLAGWSTWALGVLAGPLVMFGIGVALVVNGLSKLSFAKRFQLYKNALGNRTVMNLDQLAQVTGRSLKTVTSDVQKMIEERMFRQGHLDAEKTSLMITDQAYQQYLDVMQSQAQQKKEEEQLDQSGLPLEAREIIKQGNEYLKKIHQANDLLPDENVSRKLQQLEDVITRILEEVKKQPSSAGDLRKLMNYYLPTTWKLINAYIEVENQPVKTDQMLATQKEIEDTLDTINEAFKNLLDSLFQKQAWDISSDISVLNTMFVQEGLKKSDMDINSKK